MNNAMKTRNEFGALRFNSLAMAFTKENKN